MTTELRFLVASVLLGLVHLIAASHLISWQRGYRWTASSREGDAPPLRGIANRVDQATTNFLETFPFFAALVLLAHVTGHHSVLTVLGAHLYFWGRVGYLVAAVADLSLLRSALCWNLAAIGILLFVIAMVWQRSTNAPNQAILSSGCAPRTTARQASQTPGTRMRALSVISYPLMVASVSDYNGGCSCVSLDL